jgi:hypothetical protein
MIFFMAYLYPDNGVDGGDSRATSGKSGAREERPGEKAEYEHLFTYEIVQQP